MNEKEQLALIQMLEKQMELCKKAMKRNKINKILYHYNYHLAAAIEKEIVLIKNNKIK